MMNKLIKELGGYDAAKAHYDEFSKKIAYPQLRDALLEYRRENNIFEVDDKIIYHSLPHKRLFYVKAVLNDSIVVRECWDEAGAKCFSEFNPYSDIRHATDAEIEAGYRL